MARLLAPDMFGIMTIATMVMVILSLLSDLGLRQNIVQSRRGDDPVFLDTVWVVQIIRGFVLWLAAIALSVALYVANAHGLISSGSVYASSLLPLIIAVSSASAAILGFQSTKGAIAERALNQKRLVQIELLSQTVSLSLMIAIGLITGSIWSLVVGGLVASLTVTVLSHVWMPGHSNSFRWDQSALHELLRFGKWILISSVISVFASQGDRLVLGVYFDANVLGLFAIVLLIIRAIENGLYKLFAAVSLPVFSEIARERRTGLRAAYYKISLPSDLTSLFMVGLLGAAGQLIIQVLYDPRYSGAGDLLRILGLSLLTVRYGVAHQLYLAVGRPEYVSLINTVRFIALYVLVPMLYQAFGKSGVTWGIALHTRLTVPFVYYFNARLGLIDMRRELLALIALPLGFMTGSAIKLVSSML